MSFLKTGLLFSLIKRVIVTIFKAVYAILSFFNLHLTLLVGLVGLVLFLTGVFDKYPSVQTGFYIAIIASILVAIVVTIRKLLGLSDKKRKRKGIEIMDTESAGGTADKSGNEPLRSESDSGVQAAQPFQAVQPVAYADAAYSEYGQASSGVQPQTQYQRTPANVREPQYPVYYAVKQNRNYIMAEYADRYELYFKDRNGLKKIRTDMKTENKW